MNRLPPTTPQHPILGSTVFLQRLKREGQVVEHLADGRVRVAFGAMVVTCAAHELSPPRRSRSTAATSTRSNLRTITPGGTRTVDLHGLRVEDAQRTVEAALNRAALDGVDELRIVHGIGSGKVQRAVHQLLASLPVVRSFKLAEGNVGVTRAFL